MCEFLEYHRAGLSPTSAERGPPTIFTSCGKPSPGQKLPGRGGRPRRGRNFASRCATPRDPQWPGGRRSDARLVRSTSFLLCDLQLLQLNRRPNLNPAAEGALRGRRHERDQPAACRGARETWSRRSAGGRNFAADTLLPSAPAHAGSSSRRRSSHHLGVPRQSSSLAAGARSPSSQPGERDDRAPPPPVSRRPGPSIASVSACSRFATTSCSGLSRLADVGTAARARRSRSPPPGPDRKTVRLDLMMVGSRGRCIFAVARIGSTARLGRAPGPYLAVSSSVSECTAQGKKRARARWSAGARTIDAAAMYEAR